MTVSPSFLQSKVLQLVAVMTESFLVGLYFMIVVLICQILVSKCRPLPSVHRVLFSASIFMFLVSVVHVGLVIQELSVDPAHIPKANSKAQVVLAVIQYVTGDLILIWRLWVIWDCNVWVTIVPFGLLVSSAGTTLSVLRFDQKFFTVAPVALIAANTSICTILIVGRVWWVSRKIAKATNMVIPWKRTVILFIESGTLYTSVQLLSLILSYTQSIALPVLLDLEIPLIGILPSMIIIMAHFDLRSDGIRSEADPTFTCSPCSHCAGTTSIVLDIAPHEDTLKSPDSTLMGSPRCTFERKRDSYPV